MPVVDGPSCSGCGLPNYEGLCPHCSGDQDAYERELVPPFPSSRVDDGIGLDPLDALSSIATYSSDQGSRWVAERAIERAVLGNPEEAVLISLIQDIAALGLDLPDYIQNRVATVLWVHGEKETEATDD